MTEDTLGALLMVGVILAMVGLVLAAAQPSRRNVVLGAVAVGLLPAAIAALVLAVWALGR